MMMMMMMIAINSVLRFLRHFRPGGRKIFKHLQFFHLLFPVASRCVYLLGNNFPRIASINSCYRESSVFGTKTWLVSEFGGCLQIHLPAVVVLVPNTLPVLNLTLSLEDQYRIPQAYRVRWPPYVTCTARRPEGLINNVLQCWISYFRTLMC